MPYTRTMEIFSFQEQLYKQFAGTTGGIGFTPNFNGFGNVFSQAGTYLHTVSISATFNSSYTGFSFGSGSFAWLDDLGLRVSFANPATAFTVTESMVEPDGTTLSTVRSLAATSFPWLSGLNTAIYPGFSLQANTQYNDSHPGTGAAGQHIFAIKICGQAFQGLTPRTVSRGPSGTSIMTIAVGRIDMQSNATQESLFFRFSALPQQSIKVNCDPRDIANAHCGGIKGFLYLGDMFTTDPATFKYIDSANPISLDFPDTDTAGFILPVTAQVVNQGLTIPMRALYQQWLAPDGTFSLAAKNVESAQRRARIVWSKENFGFAWPAGTTLYQQLWQSLAFLVKTESSNPVWRFPADAGCTNVAVSGSPKLLQTLALSIASVSHTGGTVSAIAGGFKLTATSAAVFGLSMQQSGSGAVQWNVNAYRYLRFDVVAQSAATVSLLISDAGNGATSPTFSTKEYAVQLAAGSQTIWVDLMDPAIINSVAQAPLTSIEDEALYDLSHGSTGRYNGIRGTSGFSLSFGNNVLSVTNVAFDTKDKTSSRCIGYMRSPGALYRIHSDGKNAVELGGTIDSFRGGGGAFGMDTTVVMSVSLPAQSPVTAAQALTSGFVDSINDNGDYIGEQDAVALSLRWSFSPGQSMGLCPLASQIPLLASDWWSRPVDLVATQNWGVVFAQTIVPASIDTAHVDYGSGPPIFSLVLQDAAGTKHGYARATSQYPIANQAPGANPVLKHYLDPATALTIQLWQVSGSAVVNPLWHHTRMGPARPAGVHLCCDPTGVFHVAYITIGKVMHYAFDGRHYTLTNQVSPASAPSIVAVQIAWAPAGTLAVVYQESGTNRIMHIESPNFGKNWETTAQVITASGTNPAFDIDPTTGVRYCAAYIGTGWRIFRRNKDGDAWTNVAAIPHTGPAAPAGLRVSSQKDHRLEFVGADASGALRIYSSLDRGGSWTQEN